ncbi:MAG: TonB-dependent receptor, partial [Candidatus Poribacteria bacterium]|nr:TonB-dependent receptor [Candidatus Poribacteria bacterium]
ASITIVTSEEIARYGYRTVADALNAAHGVYLTNDHLYDFIGVRGFQTPIDINNRVLLLLNGQPLNESVFGVSTYGNGFPIDMDIVERIEIVRGPGSILYGSNAMFLVVNVVTKDGARLDGGNARVDVGEGNARTASANYGAMLDNDATAMISARVGESDGDDYYSPEYDRTAVGVDWERLSSAFASGTRGRLRGHGFFLTRRKGIPTGAYGARFNDPRSFQLDERLGAQMEADVLSNAITQLTLRAFALKSENSAWYVNGLTHPQRHETDTHEVGGEAQFHWNIRANNRLTAGIEYRNHLKSWLRIATDDNTTITVVESPYDIVSAYAVDEYQLLKDLSVSIGARHDRHSKDGSSATSPRGALIAHPFETTTWKLLYGEAFRAPTLVERDLRLPFALDPNSKLKPERVKTLEAVWEQRIFDHYYATLSAYHNDVQDLIVNSRVNDAREFGKPSQFRNLGSATVNGFEVEASARWENGRGGYASYGYQPVKDGETGRTRNYAPNHLVKFGISAPLFSTVFASVDGRYESSQFTSDDADASRRRRLEGFFVMDATLSTKPVLKRFRARLSVSNVFDTEYRVPMAPHGTPLEPDFHLEAATQDGRRFIGSLSASF